MQFSADQNKESGFCRFKPVCCWVFLASCKKNTSTRTKNLERQQHLLIIINELCNTRLFIHASVFAQSRLHNSPVLVKACILYGTCGSPKPTTDSIFFPPLLRSHLIPPSEILCLVRTPPSLPVSGGFLSHYSREPSTFCSLKAPSAPCLKTL